MAASRSIVNAHAERGGDPAVAARRAAEELRAPDVELGRSASPLPSRADSGRCLQNTKPQPRSPARARRAGRSSRSRSCSCSPARAPTATTATAASKTTERTSTERTTTRKPPPPQGGHLHGQDGRHPRRDRGEDRARRRGSSRRSIRSSIRRRSCPVRRSSCGSDREARGAAALLAALVLRRARRRRRRRRSSIGAAAAILVDGARRLGDPRQGPARAPLDRQHHQADDRAARRGAGGARRRVHRAATTTPSPVESKINLREGERMRVDDLLEGLLLESANDAAVTLAEGVSGSREALRGRDERARTRARPRRHELRQPDRARRPAELLDGRRPRGARPAAAAPTRSSPGSWTGPRPCSSPAPAAGW